MMFKLTTFIFALFISHSLCWEALPQIPTGHRSQFLVLHENGGYKYGYDTGDGNAAKQEGDAANQVSGHYFYKTAGGQDLDLKYTAGVQGFVPENLDSLTARVAASAPAGPAVPVVPIIPVVSSYSSEGSFDDQSGTGDASYSFNIDTDTYKRQESADSRGNVQGRYSFSNEAGTHDLSYTAGENTGFVATSGSLSTANGLTPAQAIIGQSRSSLGYSYPVPYSPLTSAEAGQVNSDGSYAFSYSSGDSSRQESADAGNNVQGSYSYRNSAGSHDLRYVAGEKTGFLVTGGSLAAPNGLVGSQAPVTVYSAQLPLVHSISSVPVVSSSVQAVTGSTDGSYSFGYSTDDSTRQEQRDASGNVQGSFSYRNAAGAHDLSFVAGPATGFLPTGGSLSIPNGASSSSGASTPAAPLVVTAVPAVSQVEVVAPLVKTSFSAPESSEDDQSNTGDASYAFNIDTDEYKRQESSDASGNVRGSFSYKNQAGSHDLSYVAGSSTGFVPTGGSLSDPNAITAKIAALPVAPAPAVVIQSAPLVASVPAVPVVTSYSSEPSDSEDDQANTGDSSYSFSIDTDEYKRQESSDASGNVRGSFSYRNQAGDHDLSFVAGSATGFLPTGGSLSDPNAITAKIAALPAAPAVPVVPVISSYSSVPAFSEENQANTGDASYAFSIDTPDYKRHESSDASGNVLGSFSYKNTAGSHDLSFVAGSATGFVPTGGSLQTPPGASEAQLRSFPSLPQTYLPTGVITTVGIQPVAPSTKTTTTLGNLKVHTYLPPSNEKKKFGYILNTV